MKSNAYLRWIQELEAQRFAGLTKELNERQREDALIDGLRRAEKRFNASRIKHQQMKRFVTLVKKHQQFATKFVQRPIPPGCRPLAEAYKQCLANDVAFAKYNVDISTGRYKTNAQIERETQMPYQTLLKERADEQTRLFKRMQDLNAGANAALQELKGQYDLALSGIRDFELEDQVRSKTDMKAPDYPVRYRAALVAVQILAMGLLLTLALQGRINCEQWRKLQRVRQ